MSIERFVDPNVFHLFGLPGLRLTEYEARVLLALLVSGENTPVEISKVARVPRSRTYNVLDSLVEKTLVEKTSDEPLTYRMTSGSIERIVGLVKEASNRFEAKLEKMAVIGSTGATASILAELDTVCKNLGYEILERQKRVAQDVEMDLKAATPRGLRICFQVKTRPELLSGDYVNRLGKIIGQECDAVVLVHFGSLPENTKNLMEQNGLLSFPFEDAFGEKLQLLLRDFERIRFRQMNRISDLRREVESCSQQYMLEDRIFRETLLEYNALQGRIEETKDAGELLSATEKTMQRSAFLLYELRTKLEDLEQSLTHFHRVNDELLNHADRLQKDAFSSIEIFSLTLGKLRNRLAELKTRRGIWYEHMLSHDPFMIAPPERPVSIFDQENLKKSFENILQLVDRTKSSVVVLITGDYGSGKTHFMAYYTMRINEKAHGNCLAVYTLARKDMLSAITDFLKQSKIGLARSWFSTKEEWPILEPPTDLYSAIESVAKLVNFFEKQGINQIYWFIDEIEKAIAESNSVSVGIVEGTLLDQLKLFIDGLQELHVSLVLSCTSQDWLKIEKQHPSIVSRLQHVFEIEPIRNVSEAKDFINYLIERVRIGSDIGSDAKKLPEFSEEALNVILRESKGNVRKMIIMSREAYWKAMVQNSSRIDTNLLSSLNGRGDISTKN